MEITVIISYYKHIPNLTLILDALNLQTCKDFDVIVSEDDNNFETINFLTKNRERYSFEITHLYQLNDDGFKKNNMLNKAILASKNEKLVFIDCDCIPNKYFIQEYIKHIEYGKILYGRRVMLGEKISNKIWFNNSQKYFNFWSLLFSDSHAVKEAVYLPHISLTFKKRGLVGCNWGILKSHLLDINGFDEDYQKAGVGEDTDIEWRPKESGLNMKSIKNKAIVFHMYHKRSYAQNDVLYNFNLFQNKRVFCV